MRGLQVRGSRLMLAAQIDTSRFRAAGPAARPTARSSIPQLYYSPRHQQHRRDDENGDQRHLRRTKRSDAFACRIGWSDLNCSPPSPKPHRRTRTFHCSHRLAVLCVGCRHLPQGELPVSSPAQTSAARFRSRAEAERVTAIRTWNPYTQPTGPEQDRTLHLTVTRGAAW